MIKVLHILSEMDGGGVAQLLYNYYQYMSDEFQFDFVVTSPKVGMIEEKLLDSCKIFHVCQLHKGLVRHMQEIEKILKAGRYDIVHDHGDYKSFFNLMVAKSCGIRVRISHSHRAFVPQSFAQKIEKFLFTIATKKISNNYFACGRDAAIWMWGEKDYNQGKVFIMPNAIEAEKFSFSEQKNLQIREELGIEKNCFVIGNVARFSFQKNHEFLVNIFNKIQKMLPNSKLLLIGDGEDYEKIRNFVSEYELDRDVLFLGTRSDVPELLNAFNVFVLPSRYEGLPVTLVEVQANGLKCYTSEVVTDEINYWGNITYLSLNEPPETWAKTILTCDNKRTVNRIKKSDYDIDIAVKKLENKYQLLLNK